MKFWAAMLVLGIDWAAVPSEYKEEFMEVVQHGINGWVLVEYDWNNGNAFFRYERYVDVLGSDERKLESYECTRKQ